MASSSFFKIQADIKKPTQHQIEIVRRRALAKLTHGRNKGKFDAKSVESLLRMVVGGYSDLHIMLEKEHKTAVQKLDSKYAQGIKQANQMVIKVEQDVRHLEAMGYDSKTSGIDYTEIVARLRRLSNGQKQGEGTASKASPSPRLRSEDTTVKPLTTTPLRPRSTIRVNQIGGKKGKSI